MPLPIQRFPVEHPVVAVAAAVVDSAIESEPWSGSVSANAPIFSIVDMAAASGPLLLRAAHRDRLHGQARVYAEERAQAAVTPVQLHVHQPARHRAHLGRAVALMLSPTIPSSGSRRINGHASSARSQ